MQKKVIFLLPFLLLLAAAISTSSAWANHDTASAPVITRQPADQAGVEGQTVSLSVGITGTWPFSYQWFKDNTAILDATNIFISMPVSAQTTGSYYIVVSNSHGTAQSSNATVSLLPNSFSGREGRYVGLFAESTANPGSSGSIVLDVMANGAYQMSVRIAYLSNSVSHYFDSNGVTRIAAGGRIPVTIDLDLEGSGFQELKGTVAGTNWTAELSLSKVAEAPVNPDLTGGYTFSLLGHAEEDVFPGGHSFGTLTIDETGNVRISGSLSDGTRISGQSQISWDGAVPIFVPLYGKSGGVLVGWFLFDASSGTGEISGTLDWVKSPATEGLYQQGFRFRTPIVGAVYEAPATGRALNVTNGVWLAEGGHISGVIGGEFEWRGNNAIRFTSNTNRVSVKISAATGTFQGAFVHPQLGTTNKFRGVLIQGSSQFGLGYFIAEDQAGAVYIGE